jgi:hypothetical protein
VTDEVTVRVTTQLDFVQTAAAWLVYNDSFRQIAKQAATRHLLTWDEFDSVMRDPRVLKYCATEHERGQLIGLGTLTNVLEAWPTISPPFFEACWPEFYRHNRIWYVGFIGVLPQYHAFGPFLAAMTEGRKADKFVMDFCAYNENRGLPQGSHAWLRRQDPAAQMHNFEQQSWWMVEWTHD